MRHLALAVALFATLADSGTAAACAMPRMRDEDLAKLMADIDTAAAPAPTVEAATAPAPAPSGATGEARKPSAAPPAPTTIAEAAPATPKS